MAAGKGTRFGDRTAMMPKGFIPFKGKEMVIRSIEAMIDAGIEDIIIGTGYHYEFYDKLAEKYPQVRTVFSPLFAETNSMQTLYCCKEAIAGRPFLLFESDIVYDPAILKSMMEDSAENIMLAAPVTKFQDQYYVEHDANSNLTNCSVNKDDLNPCGELVGIHKISPEFYSGMLESYSSDKEPKLGYEFIILRIAKQSIPMKVLVADGLQWYEIDDPADLAYAETHVAIN